MDMDEWLWWNPHSRARLKCVAPRAVSGWRLLTKLKTFPDFLRTAPFPVELPGTNQTLPRSLCKFCSKELVFAGAINDQAGGRFMDGLIYLVGLIVVVMAILSFLGLR